MIAFGRIGIGAITAIFSVLRGVLLKPLGYPQPQRLAMGKGMGLMSMVLAVQALARRAAQRAAQS